MLVEPYLDAMKAIIRKIGYDFDIQELEIAKDHIYMVIRGEPKLDPNHVTLVI